LDLFPFAQASGLQMGEQQTQAPRALEQLGLVVAVEVVEVVAASLASENPLDCPLVASLVLCAAYGLDESGL
jgi:hypothetical protein